MKEEPENHLNIFFSETRNNVDALFSSETNSFKSRIFCSFQQEWKNLGMQTYTTPPRGYLIPPPHFLSQAVRREALFLHADVHQPLLAMMTSYWEVHLVFPVSVHVWGHPLTPPFPAPPQHSTVLTQLMPISSWPGQRDVWEVPTDRAALPRGHHPHRWHKRRCLVLRNHDALPRQGHALMHHCYQR